jgi:hypothetical protein
MIFKTRPNIKKQFDLEYNFNIKNLIVSGSSFTYNNSDQDACTWPYYLRDVGGFSTVYDTSMPGAGNYHVSNSLQWAIENTQVNLDDSLVIVMWSLPTMDDYICPYSNSSTRYPFSFKYSDSVLSGITGGTDANNKGNTNEAFKEFSLTKTYESRAIENYLYILSLWNYLTVNNYKFLFLNGMNFSLPARAITFDIKKYLSTTIKKNLDKMFPNIITPYEFALRNDFLGEDGFHPSPDGHLEWTKQVLLPKLQAIIN